MNKKKVLKHLEGDMKMFKHEAAEDKKLMKSIKDAHKDKHPKKKQEKKKEKAKKPYSKTKWAKDKVEKVMHEWKEGELHSGSKKGPKVKSQKQAIAIALNSARKSKRSK